MRIYRHNLLPDTGVGNIAKDPILVRLHCPCLCLFMSDRQQKQPIKALCGAQIFHQIELGKQLLR